MDARQLEAVTYKIEELGGKYSVDFLKDIRHDYFEGYTPHIKSSGDFLNKIWNNINNEGTKKVNEIKKDTTDAIGAQNMNLIPSTNKVECRRFLLAIASGTFNEKYYSAYGKIGFKGLMLRVFEAWFNCLSINEETLILTQDWNQKIFNEQFKPVIEAYGSRYNKRVFVLLISDDTVSRFYRN